MQSLKDIFGKIVTFDLSYKTVVEYDLHEATLLASTSTTLTASIIVNAEE